jgi:MarR family transcriptional regulator for hemolysin
MTASTPAPGAEPLEERQRRLMFAMAQVNKQWRRTLDRLLAPMGLTQALWLPLLHLEHGHGPMRQKDLAHSLGLDSSSIVRLIDGLAAQGWVERIDDSDRRVKRIQLTAAGQAQVQAVKQVVAAARSEAMRHIAPDSVDAALAMLQTLQAAMEGMESGPPAP